MEIETKYWTVEIERFRGSSVVRQLVEAKDYEEVVEKVKAYNKTICNAYPITSLIIRQWHSNTSGPGI